ncbi:DUF3141 domain-containing protein [Xanthobacter dioxanivorans]|uniref:DUF3141 domain-containing protein n=1 Tax=Xanthobacter dioxanivorans TaxID=2528964 RepID=A0A974PKB4_9HYPH|nr:DUF3141 domain-containing protein [Xanthobacter dioxanivorans]QRG04625.1 DUF3141 domain-containing protein [Xanthobacter dioxanivorans]
MHPLDMMKVYGRVAEIYRLRLGEAVSAYGEAMRGAAGTFAAAARPQEPAAAWRDAVSYWSDAAQRNLIFWDTLRQRGNNWIAHEKAGKPPLLAFNYEIIADARTFARPANYALVQITPPDGVTLDPDKRPFLIIDPRAGHGPGIGGFKKDSEVGFALKAGHAVYMVIFFPDPVPGQTLADVSLAEADFLRIVRERHPTRGKPVVMGNCQGGWAAMLVAALDPDNVGSIVMNGAPMSYWAGNDAENPMRYAGGVLGGSWTALLASDLGGGVFDGAYLVDNFEYLNPGNTFFSKYYNLYSRIDSEPDRFLEFERWWGGYFLMNRAEIKWIVENLFVGNKLASGHAEWAPGKTFDLKAVHAPIIVFASLGDNITPPQQAINWVADIYPTTQALKDAGQVVVGLMHDSVGHLGIFVSGAIARREHSQIVDLLEYVEALPPGLYGMTIEEDHSGGEVKYDVTLTEWRVEDLAALQKYDRRDEIPFEVVANVSQTVSQAYESLVHPLLSAVVTPEMGRGLRAVHPLRAARWGLSDLNPFLLHLAPIADFARSQRTPRNENGPLVAAEQFGAKAITAGWDLYRQLRDATVETEFFRLYGTLAMADPDLTAPSTPAIVEQAPAEVAAALASIRAGGFTEAAVRVALLAQKRGGGQRRLSTLKQIRELVGHEVGLLALPADAAQAVIRRQAIIVDRAPDEAFATLPLLLKTPQERSRFLALVDRLMAHIAFGPDITAFVGEVRGLIAGATQSSPDGRVIPFPSYVAGQGA